MAFGSKFDRESAEKSADDSVSTATIWSFPSGSTVIHFLDDLEDWTEYWEHYDANAKRFFPCTGDRENCRGCTLDLGASHKWLSNALIVSADAEKTKPGYVNLYKVPKSLMTKVMRHADRLGTLLEHEFEIIRLGTGLDTEYDMERLDRTEIDMDKYQAQTVNHEEALQAAYDEYQRVLSGETTKPAAKAPEPEAKAAPRAARAPKAVEDAGEPPFEQPRPAAAVAEEADDEEIISEESIMKMNYDEIVSLAKRAGLEVPATPMEADELGKWLVDELAED